LLVVLLVVFASASFAANTPNITIGPQGMEGDLKVNPGDVLSAGISLTMPGTHPDATLHFKPAYVVFTPECVSGSGGGTIIVKLNVGTIVIPANDPGWYPTGDQHDPAAYQGSIAMPDLCGGGQMTLKSGGTFYGYLMSTDTTDKVNVRFHYSANGTSGSWSATVSVIPAPCQHP
ncbi:MAG TPA: hypothetical protein VF972_07060, partial [Actinomycetota bacterium]